MAGLPWIKVWTRVAGHPKVPRLERELGVKDALGIVIRLWCWTADFCPEGDIPEADAMDAAKAARGEATRKPLATVLDALTSVGLLDRFPEGYRVHDWHEMQTTHVEAEEKRREQGKARTRRWREKRNAEVTDGDASRDASHGVTVTLEKEKETERERETETDHERIRELQIVSPFVGGAGGKA